MWKVINQSCLVEFSIRSFSEPIFVKEQDDQADSNRKQGTEVSEEAQLFRRDPDEIVTSLFQMGHFINKSRRSRNQIKNLVLWALSVYVLLEVVFRFFCQIMGNRLNWEVYRHNLSFFLHLYITGVLQEELVDDSGLKGLELLLDVSQRDGQLVNQTEYIEALCHI